VPTLAAPLHAIVHLRPESPPVKRRGYALVVNGVLAIAPPLHDARRDALLLLEPQPGTLPTALGAAAAPGAELRLYGARAIPQVVTISPAGPPLVVRNDERRAVTLRLPQAPELLPAPSLQPGQQLRISPLVPAELELRSAEYPELAATLLVTTSVATRLEFSPLGEVGVAHLELPEGHYRARLYFRHRYVAEQSVTVTSDGAELVLRAAGQPALAAAPPPPLAAQPARAQAGSPQGLR
jgi:hypothetical protein